MGLDMELFLDRYGMSFALAGKQSPTTNKIWQRPMAKLNISMKCLLLNAPELIEPLSKAENAFQNILSQGIAGVQLYCPFCIFCSLIDIDRG